MGETAAGTVLRCRLRVEGIVQGVGFRPFVHALATRHRLTGQVCNDTRGVYVEVQGAPDQVAEFRAALVAQAPPLAVIERVATEVTTQTATYRPGTGFRIVGSDTRGPRQTLVSPDVATCGDCIEEIFDPADRRYRYPFTNCANCGPRMTIVTDLPYDRSATTMAGFPMCPECAVEYHDPHDRRFHAQPVCCPACGPRARLVRADGALATDGDPIEATADLLRSGHVVAVKGLGGFHLAVDATRETAVRALRARKHREGKPFAVLVASLAEARRLCAVADAEAHLLAGPRRPIVLLRRHPGTGLAPSVAPGATELGLMLPYTPLHHLLAASFPKPIVLTSGNVSDEPICRTNGEALERLGGITDHVLLHDRSIHTRADDSVVRVVGGREYPVRRSRGYAPAPLTLPRPARWPVLGCGAELKTTFCLAQGERAIVSPHIGDLENYETLRAYTEGIEWFQRLFGIAPEVLAHDLHPEYLSTKYAGDRAGVRLVGVQHHHAHIAACMAEHAQSGPVIGLALDGLGYGTDGTLWGGELLVADLGGFQRWGWLEPVPMPGGTAAIREPWRMAAAYLHAAYDGDPPQGTAVARRNAARWPVVVAMLDNRTSAPLTSSAGRLFDAVAALAGIRDRVDYEGQAAVELQRCADPGETAAYPARLAGSRPYTVRGADLLRAAEEDLRRGAAARDVAARFHNGLSAVLVRACLRVAEDTGLTTAALSGGVFQNPLLLELVSGGLERAGLRVLTHRRVPTNDGGISYGQAAVAAAREEER